MKTREAHAGVARQHSDGKVVGALSAGVGAAAGDGDGDGAGGDGGDVCDVCDGSSVFGGEPWEAVTHVEPLLLLLLHC